MVDFASRSTGVDMQEIANAIINGKREVAVELVQKALDAGIPPAEILQKGLIAGMEVVGRKFKANEFYVPEVLIAARAMSNPKERDTKPGALEILEPHLAKAGVKPVATTVIGTVKGDLHDIGKNLVAMMLRGAGFQVNDLGIDVSAEKFVSAAKETGTKLVCLSALLTTTMPQMQTVIKALKEAGLTDVKVMIGGAPVTQNYADEIGADGYAPDAASAVDKAKELLGLAPAAAPVAVAEKPTPAPTPKKAKAAARPEAKRAKATAKPKAKAKTKRGKK